MEMATMNDYDSDVVKIKQARRSILDNLNRIYDTPIQVRFLLRILLAVDSTYTMSLLQKDLAYLKQKGYVEYIDDAIGGFAEYHKKFVGLTANGKEIADRTALDDALEI